MLVCGRVLEQFDSFFTVTGRCLTINAAVLEAAKAQVVVQDVEQARHLAENKDFEALLEQLGKQQVEHFKLHTSINEVFAINKRWPWLHIFEQVRVIADLLELHEHVEQPDLLRSARLVRVNHVDVSRQDVLV